MENINPPVHRIYLIGPEKQGMDIARKIFRYCAVCDWIPAFSWRRSTRMRLREKSADSGHGQALSHLGMIQKESMSSCMAMRKTLMAGTNPAR